MGKKNKLDLTNLFVFSTDSDYTPEFEEDEETPEPVKQDLRIWLDRKKRKGKPVSLLPDIKVIRKL